MPPKIQSPFSDTCKADIRSVISAFETFLTALDSKPSTPESPQGYQQGLSLMAEALKQFGTEIDKPHVNDDVAALSDGYLRLAKHCNDTSINLAQLYECIQHDLIRNYQALLKKSEPSHAKRMGLANPIADQLVQSLSVGKLIDTGRAPEEAPLDPISMTISKQMRENASEHKEKLLEYIKAEISFHRKTLDSLMKIQQTLTPTNSVIEPDASAAPDDSVTDVKGGVGYAINIAAKSLLKMDSDQIMYVTKAFEPENNNQISIEKDDAVTIIELIDDDWAMVDCGGRQGQVPRANLTSEKSIVDKKPITKSGSISIRESTAPGNVKREDKNNEDNTGLKKLVVNKKETVPNKEEEPAPVSPTSISASTQSQPKWVQRKDTKDTSSAVASSSKEEPTATTTTPAQSKWGQKKDTSAIPSTTSTTTAAATAKEEEPTSTGPKWGGVKAKVVTGVIKEEPAPNKASSTSNFGKGSTTKLNATDFKPENKLDKPPLYKGSSPESNTNTTTINTTPSVTGLPKKASDIPKLKTTGSIPGVNAKCKECDCNTFKANTFKGGNNCSNCFHIHN